MTENEWRPPKPKHTARICLSFEAKPRYGYNAWIWDNDPKTITYIKSPYYHGEQTDSEKGAGFLMTILLLLIALGALLRVIL